MEPIRILLVSPSPWSRDLLERRIAARGWRVDVWLADEREGLELLRDGEPYPLVLLGFEPLLPGALSYLALRNRMRPDTRIVALHEAMTPSCVRFLVGNGIDGFVDWNNLQDVARFLGTMSREEEVETWNPQPDTRKTGAPGPL